MMPRASIAHHYDYTTTTLPTLLSWLVLTKPYCLVPNQEQEFSEQLHWINYFCTELTLFCTLFAKNSTAVSQSVSSNFVKCIISLVKLCDHATREMYGPCHQLQVKQCVAYQNPSSHFSTFRRLLSDWIFLLALVYHDIQAEKKMWDLQ